MKKERLLCSPASFAYHHVFFGPISDVPCLIWSAQHSEESFFSAFRLSMCQGRRTVVFIGRRGNSALKRNASIASNKVLTANARITRYNALNVNASIVCNNVLKRNASIASSNTLNTNGCIARSSVLRMNMCIGSNNARSTSKPMKFGPIRHSMASTAAHGFGSSRIRRRKTKILDSMELLKWFFNLLFSRMREVITYRAKHL